VQYASEKVWFAEIKLSVAQAWEKDIEVLQTVLKP
jgi:hypothetical protein